MLLNLHFGPRLTKFNFIPLHTRLNHQMSAFCQTSTKLKIGNKNKGKDNGNDGKIAHFSPKDLKKYTSPPNPSSRAVAGWINQDSAFPCHFYINTDLTLFHQNLLLIYDKSCVPIICLCSTGQKGKRSIPARELTNTVLNCANFFYVETHLGL